MTGRQAAREVAAEGLMQLKASILASNELAANLEKFEKSLIAARVEVASLKKHVTSAATEEVESEKVVVMVREE